MRSAPPHAASEGQSVLRTAARDKENALRTAISGPTRTNEIAQFKYNEWQRKLKLDERERVKPPPSKLLATGQQNRQPVLGKPSW